MIINVSLVLLASILLLNLFGLKLPSLGQASYYLDQNEPICMVEYQNQQSLLSEPECCLQLQQQLYCDNILQEVTIAGTTEIVDKKCSTSESTPTYLVNMKTYNFCRKEKLI